MVTFDRSVLESVRQPVGQANGLPNAFYTDPETHEAEKAKVFFANWSAIGFGKDVPEPGDALPVDFLGIPLLIVRDKDGAINVFQNTCRHRGMILVEEKTKIKGAIRCPYHSWCYGLDGALKATPHVGGPGKNIHDQVDREALGLWQIRSHTWRDVIFVNLSGKAPAFTDYAAGLIDRWSEFEQPLHHGGEDSSFSLDIRTNWKLAVENYCESYHLPWVHPGLNSYSKLSDHYNIEQPDKYSGQGTLVYRPMIDEAGTRFTDFAGLSEKWQTGAEYIALYPNLLLGMHRDHAYGIILQPAGLDRTVERIEIYYATEAMCGPDWAAMRTANSKMWMDVFKEDVFVVEGMQRGRAGPMFDGGKFSPVMDGPTHAFHSWVADQHLA
ncbi:MAG: aromatic ring-hydroxylating dioxygenase subunit alpha [Pseudomonadota bacterium]